jgi:predicted DNA-binding transcriptional regulator YafY
MIVYYKAKGRSSGVQPKEKRPKKNKGFQIILRNKAPKSKAVEPTNTKDATKLDEKLSIITDCIKNKKLLEFEYANKQGQAQVRNVEPYEVRKVNGSVVLYALCLQNEGLRMFIIANMRNVKVLDVNDRKREG